MQNTRTDFSVGKSCSTPFSLQLRKFLAKSRKCQTFHSNCEGSYSRRVLTIGKDDECLKNFVYDTMYYREGCSLAEENFAKIKKVEAIQKKIVGISQKHGFKKETHFSALWVYYFDHNTHEVKSLPVFKIYKTKLQDDAVFMDVNLNEYESWDDYLENAQFPDSFLCVPRHGSYYFDEEEGKLDLEFVSSSKAYDGRIDNSGCVVAMTPFSESAIRPWLNKLRELSKNVMMKIEELLILFRNTWKKHTDPIIKGGIFLLTTFLRIYFPASVTGVIGVPMIERYGYMLLDSNKENVSKNAIVPYQQIESGVAEIQPELLLEQSKFMKALKEAGKNCKIVLKFICCWIQENESFLKKLLLKASCPPWVRIIVELIIAAAVVYAKPTAVRAQAQQCVRYISKKENPSTSFVRFEKSQLLSDCCSITSDEYEGKSDGELPSLTELRSLLPSLDSNSIKRLEENIGNRVTAQMYIGPLTHTVLIEKVEEYVIYLFPKASTRELAEHIRNILGVSVELCLEEKAKVYELPFHKGKPTGTLYFPSELFTIGLFHAERIAKKEV